MRNLALVAVLLTVFVQAPPTVAQPRVGGVATIVTSRVVLDQPALELTRILDATLEAGNFVTARAAAQARDATGLRCRGLITRAPAGEISLAVDKVGPIGFTNSEYLSGKAAPESLSARSHAVAIYQQPNRRD